MFLISAEDLYLKLGIRACILLFDLSLNWGIRHKLNPVLFIFLLKRGWHIWSSFFKSVCSEYFKTVVLNFTRIRIIWRVCEIPDSWIPPPEFMIGLGDPLVCISKKFPSDTLVAGPLDYTLRTNVLNQTTYSIREWWRDIIHIKKVYFWVTGVWVIWFFHIFYKVKIIYIW